MAVKGIFISRSLSLVHTKRGQKRRVTSSTFMGAAWAHHTRQRLKSSIEGTRAVSFGARRPSPFRSDPRVEIASFGRFGFQ